MAALRRERSTTGRAAGKQQAAPQDVTPRQSIELDLSRSVDPQNQRSASNDGVGMPAQPVDQVQILGNATEPRSGAGAHDAPNEAEEAVFASVSDVDSSSVLDGSAGSASQQYWQVGVILFVSFILELLQ